MAENEHKINNMLTAVIELTEECNLGCTFCLRPSFKKSIMSLNILERVIKTLLDYENSQVNFIWHGGEPLILGISFFREIVKLQKKYNIKNLKILNDVQTNATLLSNDFKRFFIKNNFSVGTSIQGPKGVHDQTRIELSGKGTYDRLINNIKDMKIKPSAITVLTKEILGKEQETYNTLKKYSRGARISEYFPGGKIPNKNKLKDLSMPTSEEYGESMLKFYQIWKNDKKPLNLKPITEIITSFIRDKAIGCIYSQESCHFGLVGIKENGDFYTCLRASGQKKFFLGNVLETDPLKEFITFGNRDNKKRIRALKITGCKKCEFFNQCNGGCPQESFMLWGDYKHKTYYCKGRKMLFEEIKSDIRKIKNGL
jgi:uncharacterized protein